MVKRKLKLAKKVIQRGDVFENTVAGRDLDVSVSPPSRIDAIKAALQGGASKVYGAITSNSDDYINYNPDIPRPLTPEEIKIEEIDYPTLSKKQETQFNADDTGIPELTPLPKIVTNQEPTVNKLNEPSYFEKKISETKEWAAKRKIESDKQAQEAFAKNKENIEKSNLERAEKDRLLKIANEEKLAALKKSKEEELERIKNLPKEPVHRIDDKAAIAGGSPYTNQFIENEKLRIDASEKKRLESLNKVTGEVEELKAKYLDEQEKERSRSIDIANHLIQAKMNVLFTPDQLKNYDRMLEESNAWQFKKYKMQNELGIKKEEQERLKVTEKTIQKAYDANAEKRAIYDKAIISGKIAEQKEHSFRNEWLKPIGENATSMIGSPTIGNASDIADYGPMGARSVSNAFNSIIKPVQMAPGAGAWFKTTAGDRGLVEGLVKLNQNNMITPFGSPGTVAGGSMSKQFAYNIPLNRIGVGDVTARPGYRINIEDIRRKKDLKSKPKITRRKISKAQSKNNVSIGGSLKMNIPTFPILHSEKNGGLVNGTFKINTPKIKDTMKVNMGKSKPNDLLNVNKTNLGSLKINITPINVNLDKPQSSTVKMNANGITPFTFKNIELNLNSVSDAMKKKMKVKV